MIPTHDDQKDVELLIRGSAVWSACRRTLNHLVQHISEKPPIQPSHHMTPARYPRSWLVRPMPTSEKYVGPASS